jgi:hypothetical protein
MAEEDGEEGIDGGTGSIGADTSGSCSTSTGVGTSGPCSTSTATVGGPCSASSLCMTPPRTSSSAGCDPRRTAMSARLAMRLAPVGVRWLPRSWLPPAGGAVSPGCDLPRRVVLASPSGGTEEARRGDNGTKEGRRRDKEGEATRVWEEPPVYIPSC